MHARPRVNSHFPRGYDFRGFFLGATMGFEVMAWTSRMIDAMRMFGSDGRFFFMATE